MSAQHAEERLGLDIDTRDHPAGSYYEPDPDNPGYWRFVGPDGSVWGDFIAEPAMRAMLAEERDTMEQGEEVEDAWGRLRIRVPFA